MSKTSHFDNPLIEELSKISSRILDLSLEQNQNFFRVYFDMLADIKKLQNHCQAALLEIEKIK